MKKLIIILLILLLTGCSNYHELESLGIISSLYISYDKEYKVIAEVYKDNETLYYEATGNTLSMTINNLNNTSPNYLYYNHLNTIIIDKYINLEELIKYFIRNEKINNTFNIVTTTSYKKDPSTDLGLSIKNTLKNTNNLEYNFFNISKLFYDNKYIIIPNYDQSIIYYSLYKNNKYITDISTNDINLYNILNKKINSYIKINYKDNYLVLNIYNIKKNNNKYILETTIKELTSNVDTTDINIINDLENTVNNYLVNELIIFNNKYQLFNIKHLEVETHINKKGLILK